jgi:radical SAM-linked protein
MSEGFHPKPKLSFPLALALGIAADDEPMEFELTDSINTEDLLRRLAKQRPPGLEIADLLQLGSSKSKARARRATYEIPIPPARRKSLGERIEQLREQSSFLIEREGSREPVDLKAGLDLLHVREGNLHFRLFTNRAGSVRPREVLQTLGIADLEYEGHYLTRTRVEIAT